MDVGPVELLIVLAVVLLLFGSKKLPELAKGMGQAAKEFRTDKLVWSIAHGEATSPQFQQSFYDAVTQFMQSKDVNAFTQSLSSAGA